MVINMMKLLQLIKKRDIDVYEFNKIHFQLTKEKKEFPEEIKAEIKQAWNKEKNHCFNGEMISIETIYLENNALYLCLKYGDYKQYIGTRKFRPSHLNNFDSINYMMPLSFGCMCITKDDYLIVSKRTGTHLNNHLYGFIPEGYLEPTDIDSDADLIRTVCKRELIEEVGTNLNIVDLKIIGGIYEQKVRNFYIACIIWVDKNFDEIDFTPNKEFDSLCFITNNSLGLINFKKFTDHNLGKILLYMQQK